MPAAAAAILDGMPDARDLHRLDSGGQMMIFAGSVQLFRYAQEDTAARNVAVAVLRQLGFSGAEVAAVTGLTPNYVATLYQRSLREGTAGLIRPLGRPRETAGASWEKARAWRAAGVRDAEIARRLGVNQSTVLRRLGPAHVTGPLEPQPESAESQAAEAEAEAAEPAGAGGSGSGSGSGSGDGHGDARPAAVRSRYAGAMLLHACCYVGKGHRRQGVATAALAGAVDLIAGLGGGTVEGYPEPAGSVPAGFLYNGALSTYEELGFTRDRKIGKHRWVVTRVVEPRL